MPDARGAPSYNWLGALPPDLRKRVEIAHEMLDKRAHQVAKGYDAKHDDEHWDGAILYAPEWGAAARLARTNSGHMDEACRRAELIDVGAMVIAEIERIDRARERLSAAEQ